MGFSGTDFSVEKYVRNICAVTGGMIGMEIDMDKTAIVTGASSGIGREISKVLCELGYEVFGLGREFENRGGNDRISGDQEDGKEILEKGKFHAVSCNLLETNEILTQLQQIKNKREIKVLVNNAGVGYYGLHEELNPKKIQEMVRTNLEIPMVLTNQLLRDLKKNQGFIINISSVTASMSNPHGCAYGATKAGLTSFSHSLFDEARKYGVKVVNIQPDMTRTNLYRNADFREGEEEESFLVPQEVAEAVHYVLTQREGLVVTDMTLRPQLHRIRRKRG